MFTAIRNGSMVPAGSTNRLSTLLDHFFSDVPFQPIAAPSLPLAIWDDAQKFTVEMDAPGLPEGAFDISLHEGVLTVRAERKATREDAAYDSRNYGSWEQSVRVPKTVDLNAVTASLANGVLTVTIGKLPEAQPRKIPVSAQIGQ